MQPAPVVVVRNTNIVAVISKPMPKKKIILSIIELGGYPDLTILYESVGFDVVVTNTMRKALNQLRRLKPDVIVAEFIYGPTYGSQLSNFESLYAALQTLDPPAKLIALVNKADHEHLNTVSLRHPYFAAFNFPIAQDKLKTLLFNINT